MIKRDDIVSLLFAVLEKEVDFPPVQSDVWHTKTEGGTSMGHSTASGRTRESSSAGNAQQGLVDRVAATEALSPRRGERVTKIAQQVFNEEYTRARVYFKNWPDSINEPISLAIDFPNGYVSAQTLRGVQALINSEQANLERDERMGLSYESTPRRRAALNALQRGLNRSYQQHRDFWDGNF